MSETEHFADSEEWAELGFRCEPQIVTGPRRAVLGDLYERGCSPRCHARHIPGFDVLHAWRIGDYVTLNRLGCG